MPKNIVICCDGTNNQFGVRNTNVVRLFQALNRNPQRQLVYYAPGVGTLPEPGAKTRISQWVSRVWGLAFGSGLTRNIAEAYTFLMNWHEPGDRIYMFGFSRGSYTVRALAGMLYQFGLLPAGMENLVPYVLRLSKQIDELDATRPDSKRTYWKVTNEFRRTFARWNPDGSQQHERMQVHFLGLWDTVSSVGWIWEPKRFPYVAQNPCVSIVRHAISLDERRWFFRQNTCRKPKDTPQDLLEMWFPGDHCDVGGGHGDDTGLATGAFFWILREAEKAGMLLDEAQAEQLKAQQSAEDLWSQRQHDLLRGGWRLAQLFPKFPSNTWFPRWGVKAQFGWPLLSAIPRTLQPGAMLHRSTLLRIRHPTLGYNPSNLDSAFLQSVRELDEVPEGLPYWLNDHKH